MNRRRNARGFTLLEALIAVGMLMLLLGALAMFVEDLTRTRQFSARTAAQTRSADALYSVLEAALQTAVVDGGPLGSGVTGPDRSVVREHHRYSRRSVKRASRDRACYARALLGRG